MALGKLTPAEKATALAADECTSFWPGCRPTEAHCLRCHGLDLHQHGTGLDRGAPPGVRGGEQGTTGSLAILCELIEGFCQFPGHPEESLFSQSPD